jgi:hypothetical protein
MSRLRSANKRKRRVTHRDEKRCTHYRATNRNWFWTWEVGEYAGCVILPLRAYRYYGN